MVTVDGQKMGKSLDNFITLKQAFSGAHERLTRYYDPLAIRQLILNSHYRSPLDFSDAALFAAQSGYKKITETARAVRKRLSAAQEGELDGEVAKQLRQTREKFEAAMDDDLNTSVALSVVFELVRLANKLLEDGKATAGTLNAVDDLFSQLGGDVLGIVKDEHPQVGVIDDTRLDELVQILIEQRNEARQRKDYAKADELRERLEKIGIVLEDKPDGTQWRWK
jgi:cysteinyl-tRNA synthetase